MWAIVILGLLGAAYGQWTTYVSQREVQALLTVEGEIWAATSGGLFRWNPRDSLFSSYSDFGDVQGPEVLSLVRDREGMFWLGTAQDGLIRWSPEEGVLQVYPVFAKDRVQALWTYGDSLFVGMARNGVCLFSIGEGEVLECYQRLGRFSRGTEVRDLAVFGDTIFVGTEEGIAWAPLDAPNLYDPASWETRSSGDRYIIGRVNAIASKGDTVFIGSRWGVFHREGGEWKVDLWGPPVYSLAARCDTLAAATKEGIYLQVGEGEWELVEIQGWVPYSLMFADDGLWAYLSREPKAIVRDHMLYLVGRGRQVPLTLGPPGDRFTDLAIDRNGVLWAATSIRGRSPGGLYRFDGEHWSRYAWGDVYRDAVTSVAVDAEGSVWAGTWGKGMFRIWDDGTPDVEADSVVWITPENSPLSPTVTRDFCVVSDIAVDNLGRIWVANYMAHESRIPTNTPIVVLDGFPPEDPVVFDDRDGVPDGEGTVVLPLEGKVWFGTHRMGLALLYYGPSLQDKWDDRWVHISTASFPQLTNNKVLDIEVARDGRVLVATEDGLNVLRGGYRGGKFEVEDWETYDVSDGLPSNFVYAVCTTPDGGIWLGTDGGLVHLKDGSAVTYTRQNSPLVNNFVYALLFDSKTGYLWVGTAHGLSRLRISLTSEISAPVEASPNPFSPEEGPLTFRNLPEGSSLCIFSPSGELVRSLSPKGGKTKVDWKGDNDAGYLVGSGVYLYVVRDPQGGTQVGKVALVRR
ncbi:MAG TPA: hypothetical protein EYP17_10945 [Candidatus Latescibacteria bacterium]|nr:hypothetical protein [Candidatus Latescibacterota bacterium]